MRISDGTIYKQPNGKYRFSFYFNKKKVREGGFVTKSQARFAMEKLKRELLEGKKQREDVTVAEAYIDYLNFVKDENSANWYRTKVSMWNCSFKEFFKEKYVTDIAPINIQKYKHERKKQKCKNNKPSLVSESTIDRELSVLKHFFGWCRKQDYCATNPAEGLKLFLPDNRRDQWLTVEESKRLFGAMNDELMARVWLCIGYGLRHGEAGEALLKNLNWKDNTLKVSIEKKRRKVDVVIDLPPELTALIVKIPHGKGEREGYIFRYKECRKSFKTGLIKAGIDPLEFHYHDLKHTAGTWLKNKGVHITDIQKFLHHQDVRTTERYLHMDETEIRKMGQAQASELIPATK